MRILILTGCGMAAAGLSGCAIDANRVYTNEMYCFSALKPAGMSSSTLRQGVEFDLGKPCGALGDATNNCILVYAMYYFENTDSLADQTQVYESNGWVLKPDGGFGRVKGWRQQTLFKGTGDQRREVHIYAQPLRRSELAAREGIVLAVGYQMLAEFNSSERKTFSKSVAQILTSWRMLESCDPFESVAPKPPGQGS
jgi:hypothetical protein